MFIMLPLLIGFYGHVLSQVDCSSKVLKLKHQSSRSKGCTPTFWASFTASLNLMRQIITVWLSFLFFRYNEGIIDISMWRFLLVTITRYLLTRLQKTKEMPFNRMSKII
jgi:hypothetical protein